MIKEKLENEKDEEGNLIWEEQQKYLKQAIINDTNDSNFPNTLIEKLVNTFYNEESHGTHFVLFNPEEQLLNIISSSKKEDNEEEAQFLRSSLLAFTNIFSEEKLQLDYEIPIYSDVGRRDFLTDRKSVV